MTHPLTVDVWSDVVCPWCCIGRAHLLTALSAFEHADEVEVTYHSFELDPSAPPVAEGTLAEQLQRKFGVSAAEIDAMQDQVAQRAASVGLDFRLDIARPGSTFDAHRLLHLARATGHQEALTDRLFRAYFSEGAAIGDPATLAQLAAEAGIDPDAVAEVLASDRFADAVRADEATAGSLGVSGVPFFVIDRRYGVAGAQPSDHLLGALRQAWTEREDT